MVFHHRNKKIPDILDLRINSIPIDRVSDFNFLGLTINENLSWKPHINKISSKISKQIGIINKLKHILPGNVLRMLYCSLILPQLTYSILAWGFDIGRIEKLQKRAVRVITCSKYNAHTEPIFKKLDLLKVGDIFELNLLKFYYKFVNKTRPGYFLESFNIKRQEQVHDHDTRSGSVVAANVTCTDSAQNNVRNILPWTISSTDAIILDKIHTHSPNGFANYIKQYQIKNYSSLCNIQNCYICSQR